METKVLELQFVSIAGRRFTISLNDPKEGLTEEEVRTAMDQVVAINAFRTTTGDIGASVGARIITRHIATVYQN